MAHDNPFAGAHMGITKTRQRLSALYYFPKMNTMVSDHVKCCKECQLTARKLKNERLPLQHVDILQTHPFDDVTLDVMGGSLPVTARGNKFLLVVTCNVSHWVHAIPLRNLTSQTIADRLIELFCTFGIPRVCRADNMKGFKSELMTAVCDKLGISMRHSAPFHFQSHGIVERANLTIETMLRKFVSENPKHWDVLIQYLLFAMRDVPHAGTKYSPTELVFGRKVRGLLNVMRDTWTNGDPATKELKMSTAKYIEQLRHKIETALTAARQNMTEAETKMKLDFDKHSSVRSLKPGDLALILMPTSGDKLTARWRGPHKVLRYLGNGNYELAVGRRRANLHINSLRQFHVADTDADTGRTNMMVVTEDETTTDEPLMTPIPELIGRGDDSPVTDLTIGEQLSAEQQTQLRELLSNYPDVFSDKPGRTDLIQHTIRVTDDIPTYQAPFRIPENLREPVENELKLMLENGIIQYDSETTYNSPLIVVKKPTGGIRLVNDFKKLNAKSVNDQYPMRNASELLSRVAGARFVSRIDIQKFFWQIPIEKKTVGAIQDFLQNLAPFLM